ncbi:MAG: hypothetical protein K5668_10200 [Lachnospiraceae bacterium]|nr:hypothetical protein [Lachnospiraceae bacterium]
MDGLNIIMDNLKGMMDELFDGVEEKDGIYRSRAQHIGVTDVTVIVEALLESGVNQEHPYPVIHFHTTLAANIPEEYESDLCFSLNRLNNAISLSGFPSFGCFCYHPDLKQVFLGYRLPVNPTAPNDETVNIQYYLGVLYEELDAFADYIMFLCDNKGISTGIDEYLDYIKEIDDWNDIEKRAEELSKVIEKLRSEMKR